VSGSAVASLTPLVSLAEREGVRAASGFATAPNDLVTGRVLPVPDELARLLPWGGLRRGSTVSVRGSMSLLCALLATATAGGSWAAVVGVPDLGLLAAAEFGVAVHRLVLVPRPGEEFPSVVAALLDGVDLVAAAPPGDAERSGAVARAGGAGRAGQAGGGGRPPAAGEGLEPRVARRLSARARQRGSVLLPLGHWPGADAELSCADGRWSGLGHGHGYLRQREVLVLCRGRGAAARPVRAQVRLPAPGGALGSSRLATTAGSPATVRQLPEAAGAAVAGAFVPGTAVPGPAVPGAAASAVVDAVACAPGEVP
jgi:hypothetical protein